MIRARRNIPKETITPRVVEVSNGTKDQLNRIEKKLNQPKEHVAYKFDVKRDKDGFMTHVIARPYKPILMGDE